MKTELFYPLILSSMQPNLRTAFLKWEEGTEVKSLYPHATFFRYRKAILEATGIDISIKRENSQSDYVLKLTVKPLSCSLVEPSS